MLIIIDISQSKHAIINYRIMKIHNQEIKLINDNFIF